MDQLPRFRAPKRRKANKQAVSEDGFSGDDSHPAQGIPHATTDEAHTEEDESVLVRAQRKHTSLRKGGMSFTATTVTSSLQHPSESSLVLAGDHGSDTTPQQQNRFVAPTGQVVDIDRHMTAFIDSRLSRQQQGTGDNSQQEGHLITRDASHGRHDDQEHQRSENQTLSTVPSTRSSTVMHGNSALSVQAYLLSEVAIAKIDSGVDAATPGRGKLRRHRQRPEQDIARDALVDKLLEEHAPGGHYSAANAGPGSGEPAAGR
ncbi:hypothetical protein DV736_g5969, partial [Chaetothyriales sp. CBS 134916]